MPLNVVLMQLPDRFETTFFEKLLTKVDVTKQEKIRKFYQWKDAYRSLFSDLLVRSIIIKSKMIRNSDIHFYYTSYGKPLLKGIEDFDFNVSHAGEWIACVVDDQRVGVDVEEITDIDLSISQHYFHPIEHNDIINNRNANERFFDYWTLKESYIKFMTKGLSYPLQSFRVNWNQDHSITIIEDEGVVRNTYLKQYDIAKNYKMAVCSEKNSFPGLCSHADMNDIIEIINSSE